MTTRRRLLSLAGGIGLLVARRPAFTQPAAPLRRVGFLGISSPAAAGHLLEAFKSAMRDLGWVDGSKVEYRVLFAGGDADRLQAMARELVAQQVELILSTSIASTRAAQRATTTIPIVMASSSNPVGNGFVTSLARPGGNITGNAGQVEEVMGKRIEILHDALPGAVRIAVLLNNTSPSYGVTRAEAMAACATLRLVAIPIDVGSPAELEAAARQIVQQRAQAVVVQADGMFYSQGARLQEFMAASRLPAAYGWREQVVAGGLLSYGADLRALFRHSAKFVDKILRGAKPAELPVEQPTKFELIINLKTAKALGLTIPQSLLLRADEVIQ